MRWGWAVSLSNCAMKILFIGEIVPHSRTLQRKQVLEEMGCEVTAYSTLTEHSSIDGTNSILNKILWKMGFPLDLVSINKLILAEVLKSNPDILWIEKGNTIYPHTLKTVRILAPSTKIVSFSEDDMFALHNRSWFYTLGLKHYSAVLTTKSFNCDELPRLGAKKVLILDNTYDINHHKPLPVTPDDKATLGGDVVFIGTYEKQRAESLLYIASNGIPIRIWGNGWLNMKFSHPNLRIEGRPLYGDSYIKSICSSRINLCFLRKSNRDQQTCRSIEIQACGGFMLAERTEEHMRLFKEGFEAEYFGSNAELLGKIKYYLENNNERRTIAENGRQRCITGKYDSHTLLKRVLHELTSGFPIG